MFHQLRSPSEPLRQLFGRVVTVGLKKASGGTDGAGNKTRIADSTSCQVDTCGHYIIDLAVKSESRQLDRAGPECISLDIVTAGVSICPVDLDYRVGLVEVPGLGTLTARESAILEHGSHRTVAQDGSCLDELE